VIYLTISKIGENDPFDFVRLRMLRHSNLTGKGGETMSLEAIREIQRVEEAMDASRAEARAQAQKILSDAEREGRALLEQGKEDAAKKAAAEMTAAEGKAAKRREEILAAAGEDCASLSAGADAFMAQAVKMIVERVVES